MNILLQWHKLSLFYVCVRECACVYLQPWNITIFHNFVIRHSVNIYQCVLILVPNQKLQTLFRSEPLCVFMQDAHIFNNRKSVRRWKSLTHQYQSISIKGATLSHWNRVIQIDFINVVWNCILLFSFIVRSRQVKI